ncbi:PhoD-like phosphatase N-terminal domain-containing protein [Streptomyces spiralis]
MRAPRTRCELSRRRRLLAVGGGGAGLFALNRLPAGRGSGAVRLPDHPFRLGVTSGDPTTDGVVLWSRPAPVPLAEDGLGGMPRRAVPVRREIAEDGAMRRVVRRGTVTADPDCAHSVHVVPWQCTEPPVVATGHNVHTGTDGRTFTRVAGGAWAAHARLKTATVTPVTARYVRLEAASAGGGSCCSAAEITAG